MRPIRLEMKSFTAYRDRHEIDFDGNELDLFAISGPTGSGKSSILDAMTYALYGRVERIGKQGLHQLISQGQPTMAVIFEFAVGDARFRVARRTSAKGVTQVLLERAEGDGWVQAGEGADRVGPVNRMIEHAVGLDYEAFTRTVLLPQGRFAEFLVGEARQRRDILTDLLGLELFERLAKRAGEAKRQAEADVRAKTSVLETEYAGVSPDVVAEAEAAAKAAAHREEALAAAEASVREIHDRWAESARLIADLEACERDLREAGSVGAEVAGVLEDLQARSASIATSVAERKNDVSARERSAAKALAAREKAEAAWGRTVDLVALRAAAERLLDARDALAEAEEELAAAEGAIPALRAASAAAEERVTAAVADADTAIETFEGAQSGFDEAQHADLVAAVRAGVREGDDCPVCGAKIQALPRVPRALPLEKARAALDRATTSAQQAQTALADAQRARDRAVSAVEAAEQEAKRCAKAATKARTRSARLEAELAGALGATPPGDPLAAIDERLERLEELEAALGEAQEELEEARRRLADTERERDSLAEEVAEARGTIGGLAVAGLLDRARGLADGIEDPPPPLGAKGGADALATWARGLVALLERSAETVAAASSARRAGEREAALEAAGHLDGLVDADVVGATVAEVLELASSARTAAARQAATAADRAAAAAEKLANAEAIVEQIAEARSRGEVFDALGRELRQDRLIAFLQVEALQVLATAGSERLSALSQGRYRLEYADDEFSVVDTWNGEERRSARTLSGGETFLASLALALALSEQVRSLAVTEKARLDSLFLDEGFGTLDPESLEVVVEAIEQLGGDGRLVGVITHVQELAIRLPARVEIEKSPRGSSLRVVR
ncbi:MAG TPA: SMC family ATPase [Actinomycetota bacterium]|nr:SMC family ATPase [Actinomycetota bacterium]